MTALDDEQRRRLKGELLLEQIEAQGLDLDDLVALRDRGGLGARVTVAAYVATVRKSYKTSTRGTYDTYFRQLTDGLGWMCGCLCDDCVSVYGKTHEVGGERRPVPCPCDERACGCPKQSLAEAGVDSCADRWLGVGSRPVASLATTDIEQFMSWSQLRGRKHWAVRNRKRAAAGRALHSHDGRHAAEHAYNVAGAIVRSCGTPFSPPAAATPLPGCATSRPPDRRRSPANIPSRLDRYPLGV